MVYKILSKEIREGNCSLCEDKVYEMLFIKSEDKKYMYTCYDCLGEGSSRRYKEKPVIEAVDEVRIAREEIVDILLNLAEEDESIFNDPRLSVVNLFKDEIVEGKLNVRLEKYIKFNGNDITEVLRLRHFAIEANKYLLSNKSIKSSELILKKYGDLVNLYKSSRIRKLSSTDISKIRLFMTDRDIQELNSDYNLVWKNLDEIRLEVNRDSSLKRYDNLSEIREVLDFYDKKVYLTEYQLKRLKSFYYEMERRNRGK